MSEAPSSYTPGSPETAPYGPYRSSEPEEAAYGPERAPYAPEEIDSFERRALEAINAVAQRDDARARERFTGLFGRAREWFDREGKRREAETLEQAGVWEKKPKWKKWLKIGAKVAGGVGVATAMVMTGGAGAVLTPVLWAGGVKEAWDGALQAVEAITPTIQIGERTILQGGRGRARAELSRQTVLQTAIDNLKNRVREGSLTEEEFQGLVNNILEEETQLSGQQETNMGSERKWRLGRSIASTALTLGTGLFSGVPLGVGRGPEPTKVGNVFLDNGHRVMWNMHGSHFLYNSPDEMSKVAGEVAKHGYQWTIEGTKGLDLYGIPGHILGHGLNAAQKTGLAAAGGYLIGRWLEQYLPRGGKKQEEPRAPYGPYGPTYGPYGPGSGYGPDGSAETGGVYMSHDEVVTPEALARIPERTVDNENEALANYWNNLSPEYQAELQGMDQALPKMDNECRMAVCIPASYAEHRIIYHTLEQYLNQQTVDGQPLPPEAFEIDIFVNGPQDKQSEIDQTVEEVKRFQSDHPELKVNVVSKAYTSRVSIGEIRKLVNDLAIKRDLTRDHQEKQFYLLFNDADCEGMDQKYLNSIIGALDNNKEIEAVSTFEDYSEEDMKKYPLLHAARRLHQFSLQAMSSPRYGPDAKMLGLFYGMRSSAYAEAGGYDSEVGVAEDIRLGEKIAAKSPVGRFAFKKTGNRYLMNARRTIDALERGRPMMESYWSFGMDETLREAVSTTNLENMTSENPDFPKALEQQATGVFNNVYARFFWPEFDRNPEVVARREAEGASANVDDLRGNLANGDLGRQALARATRVFDRAMSFWGADYRLDRSREGNFRVVITNWDRLNEGLARAQTT